MGRRKVQVTDAHRVDRIRLLQEDPDRYFETKRRIKFGFTSSRTDRDAKTTRK